jgi:hypothetical protein
MANLAAVLRLRFQLFIALTLLPAAPLARADAPVIMPNQEALIGRMLGTGKVAFPGGCTFSSADINMTLIRATYACGANQYVIELRHPDGAPSGAPRTTSFALVADTAHPAPKELVDALVARVKEQEGSWKWSAPVSTRVDLPVLLPSQPPAAVLNAKDTHALTADQLSRFQAASRLLETTPEKSLDQFTQLAAENPYHGILQMIALSVASIPSLPLDKAKAIVAAADADPSNPAKHFAAGVASQIRAHLGADTPAERLKWGEQALKHFNASLTAYEPIASFHVFRAISEARLGKDVEAESDITRASALDPNLPEVFYARAELHQTQAKSAQDDLAEYARRLKAIDNSANAAEMSVIAADETERLQGVTREHHGPDGMPHRLAHGFWRDHRLWIVLGVLLLGAAVIIIRTLRDRRQVA